MCLPIPITVFIIILGAVSVQSAKILSISFFQTTSHKIVYDPLITELGRRGHQMTVVTSILSKTEGGRDNIHEVEGIPLDRLLSMFKSKPFGGTCGLFDHIFMNPYVRFGSSEPFAALCEEFLRLEQIQRILSAADFELVIVNGMFNECIFGILPHLKAPYIVTSTIAAPDSLTQAFGSPAPVSFIPSMFLGLTDQMTFLQRASNMLMKVGLALTFRMHYNPAMETVYRSYLGSHSPSIDEILANASLILSNAHFTTTFPRPLMPDIVEVGGIHCVPAEPLSEELEKFVAGAGEHGVIYFSLGSVFESSKLPANVQESFMNVFSKLPQRVLWKWSENSNGRSLNENRTSPVAVPSNVKLARWFSQQDVLGHSAVKLFLTHGGLLSTQESIYHGVPVLGFPVSFDQAMNLNHAEASGIGLRLEIAEMTEEDIFNAINRILTEPAFQENSKALSNRFRDRPTQPLDLAVYWVEYVLRHKTVAQSPARQLSSLQYHSIDVGVVLLSIAAFGLYILFHIVKVTISMQMMSSRVPK